jgi:glycerate 2-kinase
MKVLVAPDKFKGSLAASEVCSAVASGIRDADPSAVITTVPLADGGEGTSRILTTLAHGVIKKVIADDPLGRRIEGWYGISQDGSEAYIEMACVSGLALLSQHERNPAYTSTVGTGQLILAALSENVKRIVLGIGGSATHDVGIGMATALGGKFLYENKIPVQPIGGNLEFVNSIDLTGLHPRIQETEFIVLCDVSNPLYGEDGAARIFAPQKGADEQTVQRLEKGTMQFSGLVKRWFDKDLNFAGAGAAGGLGAGANLFLNARVESGIEFILRHASIEKFIRDSDLIISGEGKTDHQTMSGKVVSGISKLCLKYSKPLWVIAGINCLTADEQQKLGISRIIGLVNSGIDPEVAMKNSFKLIREQIRKEFRVKFEF